MVRVLWRLLCLMPMMLLFYSSLRFLVTLMVVPLTGVPTSVRLLFTCQIWAVITYFWTRQHLAVLSLTAAPAAVAAAAAAARCGSPIHPKS